ncbi:MAG TPA: aldo/keto reductase [Anaerolineales bacterium]|nr:aldo/keto reductase [Anaerolineales bacterium]
MTMRYQLLGPTGLRVSELCLGTMTFGEAWGWGATKAESKQQFELFAEAGGNFIDTSVNYTDGESETFLGEFLQKERERFVVATKYSLTKADSTDPNSGGNSLKSMRRAVETSLKRLGTEYIDLLYLHMWDFLTPVKEVMSGLNNLVNSGRVLYIGFSDTPDWIVAEANTLASLRGWARPVALQVPYSLADRAAERALLPMAHHWGMATLAWGILESGLLTGKYHAAGSEPTRMPLAEVQISPRVQAILDAMEAIAKETGRSMAQVATNWVRQRSQTQVVPIVAARTAKQLADNLASLEWVLTPEQLGRLDQVGHIDLGFPHDFLEGNRNIFGATFDLIERRG